MRVKLKTATRVAVFSIFFVLRRLFDDIPRVVIFCIFVAFFVSLNIKLSTFN